jgi:hypothetical protein
MTVRQVARHLGPLHATEEVLGSDSYAWARICGHGVHGWARFWGHNGGPFSLMELHLRAGARTARGITIGSTRAAVFRAYGSAVLRRRHSTDLMLLGKLQDGHYRDVLVFVFGGGRVIDMVLDDRGGITNATWTPRPVGITRC